MPTTNQALDILYRSLLVRSYSLFFVFPVFLIHLCLYLNVDDRPEKLLFFLAETWAVFFIMATIWCVLLYIFSRLSENIYEHLLRIVDVLFVALFVLAVFFPVQHVTLDGQTYIPVPVLETIKQIVVPVLILVLLFVLLKNKFDEFKVLQITILMASVFFIVFSTIYMNSDDEDSLSPVRESCELGKRNVIFLIVETFQGNYIEELVADSPELFTSFSGMTLFPKAVTSVTSSRFSTIQIFSGRHDWSKYNSKIALGTLDNDSLMTTARELGYHFTGGRHTPVPEGNYAFDQNKNTFLAVRLPLMLRYCSVSILRVIPAVTWNKPRELGGKTPNRLGDVNYYPEKIAAKNNFIGLTKRLRVGNGNTFLYFFNYMTHVKILFDRYGNTIYYQPQNKETQMEEYRYALTLYAEFLDKLKSIGVYDDSLIIIMGDHGAYNEPMRSYNPAVFIKPPKAEGKLAISQANLIHTDIRPFVEICMRDDDACKVEFSRLLLKTGPREIPVFIYPKRNVTLGRNYKRHNIFGDIGTITRSLSED